MNSKIFNGVRVLDFTRVLAGPYATRILGDFGAEVIKVQSKKTSTGAEDNSMPYFSIWNSNKLSIALDMSFAESRGIALKLASKCDVVIENFSPRVMSNWGLMYDELRKAREDIIMVSMSSMGHTGPWKDFTAFAPTIQSLSGFTYLTSYDEDHPAGPGYSYSDIISGLYCVMAVIAALQYRDRTGTGQFIDLSEYEAICTLMGPAFLDISVNHKQLLPEGESYIPAAPYGCYQCLGKDRWCVIAVFNETEWDKLISEMGRPEWTGEERFSTLSLRKMNGADLDRLIGQWTIRHSPEEIIRRLQKAGIPCAVVQNAEDLANDPQLLARNYFVEVRHPVHGMIKTDKCPVKFKDDRDIDLRPSPALGQDNRYVYRDLLGMSEDEIDAHIQKGVFA